MISKIKIMKKKYLQKKVDKIVQNGNKLQYKISPLTSISKILEHLKNY